MDYLDFDLEVETAGGRDYRIAAHSPEGDWREAMRFPFDELELENALLKLQNALLKSGGQYRAALAPEEQAVQDFGRSLFETLLFGNVRALYDACRSRAAQEGRPGVRLRLRLLAPELAALPWEYLYDPRRGEYLCLSRRTPLVRYPEVAQPMQPLLITPPLRILAMIASPSDQPPLRVERERERLRLALKDLEAGGLVKLEWLPGQTWRDLQRAMRGGPWHVFHFIGHGGFHPQAQEGVLALANDEGTTHLLGATQLAYLLANHDTLRLALLNACEGATSNQRDLFSSTAAQLSRHGIPAVLAMQYAITDRAAIECSRAFYEALADGLPVDAALGEARTAIHIGVNNSLEWGTPVLYLRSPDSALFRRSGPSQSPGRTPDPPATVPAPTQADLANGEPAPPARTAQPVTPIPPKEHGLKEAAQANGAPQGIKKPTNSAALPPSSTPSRAERQATPSPPAPRPPKDRLLLTWTGTRYVTSVAWSPDGKRLAAAPFSTAAAEPRLPPGLRPTLRVKQTLLPIWDVETGNVLCTLSAAENTSAVAWSPDGKRLFSAGSGAVQVWEAATGQKLFRFSAAGREVAWSPDGQYLATVRLDNAVLVWNAETGTLVQTLIGLPGRVTLAAWSPDRQWMASTAGEAEDDIVLRLMERATAKYAVRIWEAATGQQVAVLKGHTNAVHSVAWSPDGRYLASSGHDGTIRLWSVTQGKQIATFKGRSPIWSVAWSPDGVRLVSGGEPDPRVCLWEVASGKLLATFEGHTDTVLAVAWSPDGTRIASAGRDKTVRVWAAG